MDLDSLDLNLRLPDRELFAFLKFIHASVKSYREWSCLIRPIRASCHGSSKGRFRQIWKKWSLKESWHSFCCTPYHVKLNPSILYVICSLLFLIVNFKIIWIVQNFFNNIIFNFFCFTYLSSLVRYYIEPTLLKY